MNSMLLRSSDALVSDPQYPRLKEHLIESTGLMYYADKDVDLARRIGGRLATAGAHDCASYLDILCDPLRGPSELDALIAEITIGETYFFRHPEHFDALRDVVLPDLIARNKASRCLRIWCAGCADGPEPYSLAIMLKREMAQQLLGWRVTILGTDINRRALARARQGKFEEWAFRSTSDGLKHSCFSKEGTAWNIAPEYKESVSFQYLNLVKDSFPSFVNNLFSFDLIVCRNVMIYFGPDHMKKTVQKFYDCLVRGAWLLVGPSEPNMTCFTSFRDVNALAVTLYQKPHQAAPVQTADALFVMSIPAPSPLVPPPALKFDFSAPDGRAKESASPALAGIPPTLADVRGHADEGDWEKAARCCEQLLKKDNLNSMVHFYKALILEQTGKHAEAERSLRQAIYLDRQSILAHYYLGLFLQSRGDPRQAARSFENTLRLLHPRNDADVFSDADGITVAELKELTEMNLDILRERV